MSKTKNTSTSSKNSLKEALETSQALNDELRSASAAKSETIDNLKATIEKLVPRSKALDSIGDAIVQAGWAENSADVGSVSAAAKALIWKYRTCLEQLGDMREKYEQASQTIAQMHAAAVGSVRAPKVGFVEDVQVATRRSATAINALLRKIGAAAVRVSDSGKVELFFEGSPTSESEVVN